MILAIDPGNEESAWCLLHDGVPETFGKEPNAQLLERLRVTFRSVEDPLGRTELLAIEMIASYGMAVGKEVFDTCIWIGRFIEAWEVAGGKVKLVYRREVKLYHCESVKASDSNIRAAIIDRFGPGKEKAIGKKAKPGPLFGLKGDHWSALAVALTAAAPPRA